MPAVGREMGMKAEVVQVASYQSTTMMKRSLSNLLPVVLRGTRLVAQGLCIWCGSKKDLYTAR